MLQAWWGSPCQITWHWGHWRGEQDYPKEKYNGSFYFDVSILGFKRCMWKWPPFNVPSKLKHSMKYGLLQKWVCTVQFVPFVKGFWICCVLRWVSLKLRAWALLCLSHLLDSECFHRQKSAFPGGSFQRSWPLHWFSGHTASLIFTFVFIKAWKCSWTLAKAWESTLLPF